MAIETPSGAAPHRQRMRNALGQVPPWMGWAVPAAVFLLVSFVWVALDWRVADYDMSRHFVNLMTLRNALSEGVLDAPLTYTNANSYPPLLYLVGIPGTLLLGLENIDGAIVSADLVFVPLLAAGCWGAARIAYGNLAGWLAASVALGSPMIVSLFHIYMLDAAQAACVAACVALVLASRRFGRPGIAALAGVAGGAAMLIKPTSVLFLGGFFVVVLVRGGWRNPYGLGAFLVVGAIVSGPWYLEHWSELRGLSQGATGSGGGGGGAAATPTYLTPPRWSITNAAWYGWNLMNAQLLAPLFVAFVAGTVTAVARFVRRPRADDITPELVIGGLVSYLSCTYLVLKDPRYTLPAIVFVAALAAGWVPSLAGRARVGAAIAVFAFAVLNFVGTSFGLGGEVRVKAPGSPPTLLGERSVRIYWPAGYLAAQPRDDRDVERLMRAVKAARIDTMELDPGGDATWNTNGLELIMARTGLRRPPSYNPSALGRNTVFLTRHLPGPGLPRPCGRISGGYGLYLIKGGNAAVPFEQYKTWCPPGMGQSRR